MQGNEFQEFPSGEHFEHCNLIINFELKKKKRWETMSKLDLYYTIRNVLKFKYWKWADIFHFSFELKVMIKLWLKFKIDKFTTYHYISRTRFLIFNFVIYCNTLVVSIFFYRIINLIQNWWFDNYYHRHKNNQDYEIS